MLDHPSLLSPHLLRAAPRRKPGLTDIGEISPDRAADPKLSTGDVARAVLCALEQPESVDVSEIVVRPVGQHPFR